MMHNDNGLKPYIPYSDVSGGGTMDHYFTPVLPVQALKSYFIKRSSLVQLHFTIYFIQYKFGNIDKSDDLYLDYKKIGFDIFIYCNTVLKNHKHSTKWDVVFMKYVLHSLEKIS